MTWENPNSGLECGRFGSPAGADENTMVGTWHLGVVAKQLSAKDAVLSTPPGSTKVTFHTRY